MRYKSERRYDTLAGLEKGENQMAKKDDALLKIPSEVPSGKDVPFVDITVMSFSEAQATDDIKLGEHVVALGEEFVKRAGSAVKFVMLHRSAIQELRKRYSKQGRRNPVPSSPSWGEFCTNVFHVSQQYMNSILASAYPKKLAAKKKAARKDAAAAAPGTDGGDDDPRPEAEAMDETTAQAIAPSDEAVEKIHEAANEPDQPLPVTDAEVTRILEAAAADTLPDTGDEVAAEREDPRTEPAPCSLNEVTVSVLANILNRAFAEKKGRHEAVREMLKLLDKCVLWEISYASSEERSNRLQSADMSAQHVFPSEAAEEVLKRGGFWSAKALIGEADIHVTTDSVPNGCGVSLDHFKQHVLGWLRLNNKLKTRMLGRVNWYCHPDHEAALKAAKKPEGPEFHYAEGELQKGAAPQPPLVKPRAGRRGQDADVHVHPAPVPPGDDLVPADGEQFGDVHVHSDAPSQRRREGGDDGDARANTDGSSRSQDDPEPRGVNMNSEEEGPFTGSDREEAAGAEEEARKHDVYAWVRKKMYAEHPEWRQEMERKRAEHPEWRQRGETDEQWAARKKEREKKVRSEAARLAAATRKAQRIPIQLEDGRTGHIVRGGGIRSRSREFTVEVSDGTVLKVQKDDYRSQAENMRYDECYVPGSWLDDDFNLPAERVSDFLRPYMETEAFEERPDETSEEC